MNCKNHLHDVRMMVKNTAFYTTKISYARMKLMFTISLFILTVFTSSGQIAVYDMAGILQPATTVPAAASDPNVTASDVARGTGLTATSGANSINSQNWSTNTSAEAEKFLTLTITPSATHNLAIANVTFNARRSSNGPTTIELFTQNGAEGEVSRGSIAPTTSDATYSISFTYNTNGAPLTFRLYGYNAINGTGTFRINSLSVNGNVPLPVTLTSFKASMLGKEVILDWNTTDESKFSHFSIERSHDAKSFEAIDKVYAKATTTTDKTAYQFVDKTPNFGINYYRLRQVDIDGSYEYSRIISANMTETSPVVIYPNPTADFIRIKNGEEEAIKSYQIFTNTGRLIRQSDSSVSEISVQDLPSGTYFLQLKNERNILINRRFIKK